MAPLASRIADPRRGRCRRSPGGGRRTGPHPDFDRRRRDLAAASRSRPERHADRRVLSRSQPRLGGRPRLGDSPHHRRRRDMGAGQLGARGRGAVLRRLVFRCRQRRRHRRLRQLLSKPPTAALTWSFEPIGDDDWHLHEIARVRQTAGSTSPPRRASSIDRTTTVRPGSTLPSPYEGSYFGVLPLEGDTRAPLRPSRPSLPLRRRR